MTVKPPLVLARLYYKVDFKQKSLLYYGNVERFASKYSPSAYPLWELGKGVLRLTDHASRKRIVLEPGLIGFQVDLPDDILNLQRHITQVTRKYIEALGKPEPARLGWCLEFVTPDTSFEDLYPTYATHFFGKTSAFGSMCGLDHRDHQLVVEYGTVDDGLSSQLGVLIAEQASAFRERLKFKETTAKRLPIDDNGVIVFNHNRVVRMTGAVGFSDVAVPNAVVLALRAVVPAIRAGVRFTGKNALNR